MFKFLLYQQWSSWKSLSDYGADKVRRLAQERGYNWDTITEEAREAFLDEVVHKD